MNTTLLNPSQETGYNVFSGSKGPPWWRSQRYILAYVLLWGQMNIFCQRINFSVAILCMVNHTALSIDRSSEGFDVVNITSVQRLNPHISGGITRYSRGLWTNISGISDNFTEWTHECNSDHNIESQHKENGIFLWDKDTQGLLLGAVYWTYLAVQLPGNILVRNVPKKKVILSSMALMSLCTFLIHIAALWSHWAVFFVRLVQGGCTALAIIAMYGIWSQWAPPSERSRLLSLGISGQMMGNIIVFPVSALLCKYGFFGGWPSVFYVFGFISFLWLVVCFILTDDSPEQHKYISAGERHYIMSSLHDIETQKKRPKAPWCSIITSLPIWGIIFAHVSYTWGLFLFLSTLPQYMYEVLKFDIKSNGIFSMLPYIALLVTTLLAGQISDLLIKKKLMRVAMVRKMCILTSHCIPAVALIALSFLDCHQPQLAISLLVISVGATGFGLCGLVTTPFDIAPKFAAEIMTISNTLATIPGILTPIVVAAATKNQTREEWQIVLFLTSAIYICGAAGFCIMATADVQQWALSDIPEANSITIESPNSPLNETMKNEDVESINKA